MTTRELDWQFEVPETRNPFLYRRKKMRRDWIKHIDGSLLINTELREDQSISERKKVIGVIVINI